MPRQKPPTRQAAGMTIPVKLLFTAIAAVLATVGIAAIVTEVHSASTRFHGAVTVLGDDAVRAGQTALLLAAVPLLVWLPQRWVGWAGAVWWLVLMGWIFGPLILR
jgi:hypothetical protein